jgi:hypothetical protein
MLVTWTIWKKQNTRVFNKKSASTTILPSIIKGEAKLWMTAGANLGVVIEGVIRFIVLPFF